MPDQKRLFLVDAYALIFRGYYAFIKNPRINSKGLDTSAILGFMNSLLDVIKRERPDYLAVCFDKGGSSDRNALFEDYKANRDETPEAIKIAVPYIESILNAMHIPIVVKEGYEADDIIGTLASTVRSENSNVAVHILSKDKDLAQLLKNKTDCLWDYSANKRRYLDDIRTEYGVSPEQFADYLGLVGDPVDCISGVPGVGPVKAKLLLKEFGSLDGVYKNLDRIPKLSMRGSSALTNTLVENRESAFLSRTLATIQCAVDDNEETFSTVSLNMLNLKEIDRSAFALFLDDYRFCNSEKHKLIEMVSDLSTQVV